MNILAIIRSNEWWEYKFPPILAVGYIVVLNSGCTFISLAVIFIILLLSLITGAAYVSLLNDATDIADDAAAGKKNRMAGFGTFKKILLVTFPLALAAGFTIYFAADRLTMQLYICSYVCFTLYSMPPFRLKKRGFAGILADAAGSQLLPTLFVAAFLLFKTGQVIYYYQFAFIGTWSFCFGLRGILWHQFHDMKNDILSGVKTAVSNLSDKKIKIISAILLCIELLSFAVLLFTFKLLLSAIVILFYFFYLFILYKVGVRIIIIKSTTDEYRIFMNEYYQIFLPLSILVSVVFDQPSVLIILIFHVALFPTNTFRLITKLFFSDKHNYRLNKLFKL